MTNSMRRINKIAMLVGGILLATLALLVKCTAGSPLEILHLWDATDSLPPLWTVGMLWLGGYAVMGGGWLGVLCSKPMSAAGETAAYKGGMFLVIAVFFSFAWYLWLFGMGLAVLSWVSLLAGIAGAGVAGGCYLRLHAVVGLCIWGVEIGRAHV